ncbi:HET-domain-containing protein [Annulohypoxylon maeteangense]|uniref:HET-domain-containing protein n=1 Tax=Annulohypoxylon maeteangense TaxID=1927788 RepID=UPI002008ACF2|nr:HET-domain-containing protein [Annulohypoxylon maeteangense]KAI0884554.1 HET-domain-containing protein [Annulohypoxylon maeteangense]
MLCQICKTRFENIGKPTQRCLEKKHTVRRWQDDIEGTNINDYICVHEQHPFGHHRDELSFKRSAEQGCIVCRDIAINSDQDDQKTEFHGLGFYTTFKCSPCDFDSDRLNITIESNSGSTMIELIPTIPAEVSSDSLQYGALNFHLKTSTNSLQTWSMISDWMTNCSSGHERCKSQVQSNRYKPTRLLQINIRRGPFLRSLDTFQLVYGNQCPRGSSYVTLSHRWGKKPLDNTLRLLKGTSKSLKKRNPIDKLPATFRDAMYIAHRFGSHYVWIDRLCIYQDSPEDWRNEAHTMRDVYRNASFCISALSAESDEGGCFFDRDPALVTPTPVRLNGVKGTFRADTEDTAWRTTFQDELLLKRGWVLQERLMSPRTIYFGKKQVYWECAELDACETHPVGFKKFPFVPNSSKSDLELWKQLIDAPITLSPATDRRVQVFVSWSAAISAYSGTELTFPNDKLVAVSGLAQDIRQKLQGNRLVRPQYLAGLWKDVLIQTLLWYVRLGTRARRPKLYRAPSWSWASLDGRIIMADAFFTDMIKLSRLVSFSMEYLGGDDTGEVKSGSLTLSGRVCVAETESSPNNQCTVKAFRIPGDEVLVGCHDSFYGRNPTVIFDTLEESSDVLHCLWMITQPAASGGWQVSGLALNNGVRSTYHRIGIVSCYSVDKDCLDEFIHEFPFTVVKIV